MMKKSIIALCGLCCIILSSKAQEKDWDVIDFAKDGKAVDITVTEGTWMNLDVSPDGEKIVFDLLGDIYIMPVNGGDATLLREGHALELQPRFSPDGKKVSFTSDHGGADNIWIMNTDGSDAHQVTKEDFRLLNNATWTPDGQYLVARKHFTNTRSLGAGELWMYHISGGSGIQITEKKNDQQDLSEPSISPDGRYIYFSEDVYPGGYFQYNKDPNSQIYVIKRYDRKNGEIENVTGGPGGAARPQLSPDGKKMAFVKRVRTKTVLYIHELETGKEYPVYDQLSKDQQEAWAIFGVYTNFNWLPDNQTLIFWANGKINKLNIESLEQEEIPFTASAKHRIVEALRFKKNIDTDEFDVKVARHAVTSPDGEWLVFNAAGHLYKKHLPEGKPERLTDMQVGEYEPAFSKDGKKLLFVTWDDDDKGAIYEMVFNARNTKLTKVTQNPGMYRTPRYNNAADKIVFVKESGNNHQGYTFGKNAGIYTMQLNDRKEHFVVSDGEYPYFNKAGDRIYFQTGGYLFGSLDKKFKSINLNGKDEHTIFTSKYANQFVPSPDNQWLAFTELFKAYVIPMPQIGKAMGLSKDSKEVPVAPLTKDAGINLHWSGDSKTIHWTLGGAYFSSTLQDRFNFLEGAPDSIPPVESDGLPINLSLPVDKPEGIIAFTGARIITMEGDEVIENGTILIRENKIAAIGSANAVEIPQDAHRIDATGKTIMPGFVDVHAHLGNFRYGISPQQQWTYYANLAYGVTTAHDPSSNTEMIFSQAEMIRTGEMVGPRIFSTGIILYGADNDAKAEINSLEDAQSAIRRTKAFGAFSVKSYNQPRRNQRQQVIQASREEQMLVVPEGGATFFHNLSMILDGHTGIEHNIPVAPVYDDVQQLWAASNTGYTPTLIVNFGGLSGEYYFYQKTNVWEKERLMRFTPRGIIDARSRHRTMAPEEEYENGHILVSKTAKFLQDNGVLVNLGAHGQLQGLGAHWELWMLQQGGMTNHEALKAATLNGAMYLGLDDNIGTLKVGKLADLIVIDGNPLEDIRQTENIEYTMANGRLYEAETMNEVGNSPKARKSFYWENSEFNEVFDWHDLTKGLMDSGCRH